MSTNSLPLRTTHTPAEQAELAEVVRKAFVGAMALLTAASGIKDGNAKTSAVLLFERGDAGSEILGP